MYRQSDDGSFNRWDVQSVVTVGSSAVATLVSPAKILGVSKGTIENNKNADLCIYDPNKNLSIDKNNLFSSGKNTPFNGWELQGEVTHTLLNGKVVFSRE